MYILWRCSDFKMLLMRRMFVCLIMIFLFMMLCSEGFGSEVGLGFVMGRHVCACLDWITFR